MRTVTDFPRKVVEWPDVRIPMPDGVVLSARIWLPEDAAENPVPAILEHLPYRKRDVTLERDELTHPYFAGHGYACIRVDMRGTGDSEGLMFDEYEQQEWDDAIAVMDWVRAQPWSTGDWGMMGISWGGFNALQVAALRPEGLRAVISLCSTSDRYADDIHYKGGCMLGENFGWAAQMLSYSSRAPDPDVVGERWREMWLERLEAEPHLLETWLAHQRRDGYWKHGSICEDWDAVEVPVLAIGGWHDGYRNTPAALVGHLARQVKAIVGPWIHKYPHYAKPEPRIGFLQEALRWWDRWLKRIETGVEDDPSFRLYLMDAVPPARWTNLRPGRWIGLPALPGTRSLKFGDGTLGAEGGSFARPVRSPQTCGDGTGEYFPFMYGPELPGNQAADDAMSACFDGEALDGALEIVGAPVVELALAPDRPTGQIAVRLCDVSQDGDSALIAHGFLNLRHRRSHSAPEDLTPGETIDVTVTLDQCAYRIPAGHRLRVAVSTAYWPLIWPGPETADVTLTGGSLRLPVFATGGSAVTFPDPESAPGWQMTELRPRAMTRETEVLADGTLVTLILTDDGERRDDHHGLINGAHCREEWRIHPDDPLSARARIIWETRMARGDWEVTTRTTSELTATATHWLPKATVEAWENGEKVFSKVFSSEIRRDGI